VLCMAGRGERGRGRQGLWKEGDCEEMHGEEGGVEVQLDLLMAH
jgi:hypothetical protein